MRLVSYRDGQNGFGRTEEAVTPLGLSRVTENITDHLLQGIITTTDRARYYSFYCWSLWHAQQAGSPRKFADYIRAFRRREAFMALSTMLADNEAAPVGVRMVGPKLAAANRTGTADCDFKVLPSSEIWGAGRAAIWSESRGNVLTPLLRELGRGHSSDSVAAVEPYVSCLCIVIVDTASA